MNSVGGSRNEWQKWGKMQKGRGKMKKVKEGGDETATGESHGEGGTVLEGYAAGSKSCDRVNGIKKTLPTVVA